MSYATIMNNDWSYTIWKSVSMVPKGEPVYIRRSSLWHYRDPLDNQLHYVLFHTEQACSEALEDPSGNHDLDYSIPCTHTTKWYISSLLSKRGESYSIDCRHPEYTKEYTKDELQQRAHTDLWLSLKVETYSSWIRWLLQKVLNRYKIYVQNDTPEWWQEHLIALSEKRDDLDNNRERMVANQSYEEASLLLHEIQDIDEQIARVQKKIKSIYAKGENMTITKP